VERRANNGDNRGNAHGLHRDSHDALLYLTVA
jgi:hypothetical protein